MLTPNTILQNRYRIIRQLGQGGMGTVYEAIDQRFDSQVAIKETHFTDEVLRKQFEREARLLNRLRHPAMTRVIDHFTEGDGQFLVMDFVAGEELWEMLQKQGGAFPVDKVMNWADQLLDALDYLHKQEPPIIHRDIKPQNLKLSDTGQIILLDFGLAKGFAGQVSRVTTSGSIFGYTPNYAPLEQIHGTGTDARSDLYSLAATLYHLLTGKVPADALTRATAIMSEHPDPLRPANEVNNATPKSVADVLQLAMSNNPTKRPASAAKMREMLRDTSHKQIVSNEPKETMLPATIVHPVSKAAREQDVESLPQTNTEPVLEQRLEYHPPTVAAATVASPIAVSDSSHRPSSLVGLPQLFRDDPLSATDESSIDKDSLLRPTPWFAYILALVFGGLLIIPTYLFHDRMYVLLSNFTDWTWAMNVGFYWMPELFISAIVGIIYIVIGILFGSIWPQKSWTWGLWLVAILLIADPVFSWSINRSSIFWVADLIPIMLLACAGSYLGAWLSLRKTKH